jgi:hypothetical protein
MPTIEGFVKGSLNCADRNELETSFKKQRANMTRRILR